MLCLLNNHLPQVLLQWQQIFPQIGHNHSHASGFFGFLSDLNSCRDRPSDNGGDERCDRGLEAKDCGHCCRNWSAHTFKVWKERLGWSVEIIGWLDFGHRGRQWCLCPRFYTLRSPAHTVPFTRVSEWFVGVGESDTAMAHTAVTNKSPIHRMDCSVIWSVFTVSGFDLKWLIYWGPKHPDHSLGENRHFQLENARNRMICLISKTTDLFIAAHIDQ